MPTTDCINMVEGPGDHFDLPVLTEGVSHGIIGFLMITGALETQLKHILGLV